MLRADIINKIGINYIKKNMEEDEWRFKNKTKADLLFEDGRFYVVVETKENIRHELINDKPQLDGYCTSIYEEFDPEHIISILVRKDTDEVITYVDGELNEKLTEIKTMAEYKNLFVNAIDKNKIYEITMRINNNLHSNFGMSKLQHRMVFTACALISKSRFNCALEKRKNESFDELKAKIFHDLGEGLEAHRKLNDKLIIILDQLNKIDCNNGNNTNKEAINNFIDDICELSGYINNKDWRGEDVMAIFFNEFNRYRGKSELGQVFTPEHIAEFICRLVGVKPTDHVLDAACGSGTFLTKAMSLMLAQCSTEEERENVYSSGLYGVEFDHDIYSLACANMLIHKDGKTNLIHGDSRSEEIGKWIKKNKINKVVMNPPYENCYGWLDITLNVLNNVIPGSKCAFILPNNKLTVGNAWKKFKGHTLEMIIKLPTETFDAGTDTSIFIFKAGVPQGKTKVIGYRIVDDGLIRVKNKGRHDKLNKWNDIMNDMLEAISIGNHETKQVFKIEEQAQYKVDVEIEDVTMFDFSKTVVDFFIHENSIDKEIYIEKLIREFFYTSKEEKR